MTQQYEKTDLASCVAVINSCFQKKLEKKFYQVGRIVACLDKACQDRLGA